MSKRVIVAVIAALAVLASGCNSVFDFNGDDKADRVWVTVNGRWAQEGEPQSIWTSPTSSYWGSVPGNYDGDGKWEPATTDGVSWFTAGKAGTIDFPFPEEATGQRVAVPADYDGDRKTDPAWWSRSTGTWYIRGREPVVFGTPGPEAQCWYSRNTFTSPGCDEYLNSDIPIPADYDGDGRADLAVYNLVSGRWRFLNDEVSLVLGGHGEVPAVADYDGDGTQDPATFNLNTGAWTVDGLGVVGVFGGFDLVNGPYWRGDLPVPADYDGDKRADLSFIRTYPGQMSWKKQNENDLVLWQVNDAAPAEMPAAVFADFTRAYFLSACEAAALCPGFYS